ncbi:TPA: hypothetical protein HNO20_26600, partial [Escherichia coli]|nr:hypothetical protein [Escherichia coli]
IGSSEVAEIIDNFINTFIITLPYITAKDYMERLLLIAYGYPIPNDFLDNLKSFISDNIPDNLHSTDFIKAHVETQLPHLFDYLIKERGLTEFQNLQEIYNERMKNI